jgi:hypothetical protein
MSIEKDRDPILVEREKTHGCFQMNAKAAQAIKDVFVRHGYSTFAPGYREAMDLIATKFGRILSGGPGHQDHWNDIAGYAKLASEAAGFANIASEAAERWRAVSDTKISDLTGTGTSFGVTGRAMGDWGK